MIRELISLGIKGSDIVLSTLKKIEKEKQALKKPTKVTLAAGLIAGAVAAKKIFDSIRGPEAQPQEQAPKKTPAEKTDEKGKVSDALKQAAQGLSTLQSGAAAKSILMGIGSVAGPIGAVAAMVGGLIIDAAHAFKDQVKAAATTVANTEDARSRVRNIISGDQGSFLRTVRADIDVNSQRAIVEALGNKFGVVQDDLKKSITRLFGDRQNPTDVKQAAELATGNFAALGTDRGFFMQQIADSFSGLPPTVRQKMTAQMLDMIPEKDLFKQYDIGARQTVTTFDNLERDRAQMMLGENNVNVQAAIKIQALLNQLDTSMNNGMGKIINLIDKYGTKIIDNPEEGVKQAIGDIGDFAAGIMRKAVF